MLSSFRDLKCSDTKRSRMSINGLPLRNHTTRRTSDTLWRWAVVNQKFCSTTLHGYTTTSLSTQRSSLRQRVCIETGKYQKYRLTYQKTLNQRYMFGVRTLTRLKENVYPKGLRSVRSSASCWSTWRDLERRRRSLNIWICLHKARLSYLRSMRAQLLRTPRPSGLKLWLSLVRVQRTNVSLPDRPLLNRLWISTHNVGSWTNDCWDSTVTIPSKDGTLLHGLSAWVRTAFSKLLGIVTWKNCRTSWLAFRTE